MNTPSENDYVMLVERRAKLGDLLLGLKTYGKNSLGSADPQSTIFHLLLASGFSLWRAAFLVEEHRTRDMMNQHALTFLDTLLWDNAINFPQDRKTHAWSGGFYINNACFRLLRIRDKLTLTADEQKVFQKVDLFMEGQWDGAETIPLLVSGWDNCCNAAAIALSKLLEMK